MMKPHCDNCDAIIIDVNPTQRVSVQPYGFQCFVTVTVRKNLGVSADLTLCIACLHAAVQAFAETVEQSDTFQRFRRTGVQTTVHVPTSPASLDVIATDGGKVTLETRR